MDLKITTGKNLLTIPTLVEIAALWNRNAVGRHGFYPWDADLLQRALVTCQEAALILEARDTSGLLGFALLSWMQEANYTPGAALEAILVDQDFRGRGVGTLILQKALSLVDKLAGNSRLVDALGAWPYGFALTTLADGSERSGVFASEDGLLRLFQRHNFQLARKSLVMRTPAGDRGAELPLGFTVKQELRRDSTWLDRVFRNRELWNHNLLDPRGVVLSNAIYGFMPGETAREGKNLFSLFGVNTPEYAKRQGYAILNLRLLLGEIARIGGDLLEIHVYADNQPALGLYRRLGFQPVAETIAMVLVR
ncbi:MAG: GNAT family N-acetyltransferase [Planctomycetota bacterium]|jgi:ribosomal protein S18 acetylase RimI-like enzyme|nr:GNAT family N-acetyltransferase [Planctomycetota bacterium]